MDRHNHSCTVHADVYILEMIIGLSQGSCLYVFVDILISGPNSHSEQVKPVFSCVIGGID